MRHSLNGAARSVLLLGMFASAGCSDRFFVSGPKSQTAGLAVSYSLDASTRAQSSGALNAAENARIRVTGQGVALDTVVQLVSGVNHIRLPVENAQDGGTYQVTVEIRAASSLLLWGVIDVQLSSGTTTAAAVSLVAPPTPTRSLGAGSQHTCVLDEFGAAYCWGANTAGQLGTGTNVSSQTPVRVAGNLYFTELDAALTQTCAVTHAGAVYCWGTSGATGSNSPMLVPSSVPLNRVTVGNVGGWACALAAAGDAFCWGNNSGGQLGTGDTTRAPAPVPVVGGLRFQSISAGLIHACGLTAAGLTYCWGRTDASAGMLLSPTVVSGGQVLTDISAGPLRTCGITTGGGVCWGVNYYGALGNGAFSGVVTTPAPVSGGLSFASIRTSRENNIFTPTCGVTTTGQGYCWGANDRGQLGTSASLSTCPFGTNGVPCAGVPAPVAGGLAFTFIVPSLQHSCGLTTDKRVFCWGANDYGQLGNGTLVSSTVPVAVTGAPILP